MATQVFLFVDVDNATGRGKTKKPPCQRYGKEARKHVMRDIGLARRKGKTAQDLATPATGQEPNVVDGPTAKETNVDHTIIRRHENATPACTQELEDHRDTFSSRRNVVGCETEANLPVVARPIGCYRQDPFVRYPVELNDRGRLLLDTRE